jgi:hypothetical protein
VSSQRSTHLAKGQVEAVVAILRRSAVSRGSAEAETRQPSADGAQGPDVVGSRRHRLAFWMVSFAFLAVMAFSAAPSPLYGLYRARDHFSLFMITVIYAVYAVGVIGSLLLGATSPTGTAAGACYYRRWVSRSSARSSL